jgi:low temperature requirement protein LtrA
MTRSAAESLAWRSAGGPQQAAFLELFFDLTFIFALTQLSFLLARHLDLTGAFQTLVLVSALFWVWFATALLTNAFKPEQTRLQFTVMATMVGGLVMAATVAEAFGKRGLVFAIAYTAIQLGRNVVVGISVRGDSRRIVMRALFWVSVSAALWITGALFHGTVRDALWAFAVVLDYATYALGYPAWGIDRTPAEPPILGGHLAERYRQFFIVALGEQVLVTGLALRGSHFEAYQNAAFLVAFTTTALLWRIYIHRSGELLATAIEMSAKPARLARSASYAHLVMVTGVVVTAVGQELIFAHPLGHTPPSWAAVILGGPALFMAGRSFFEYWVFNRISKVRPIGLLLLAALTPAALVLPPIGLAIATAGVLALIAVSDTMRSRGRTPEQPSPPPARPASEATAR